MITDLVIISLLAGSSAAASAQPALRTAAPLAVWPHMHQCTITPGPSAEWSRIDIGLAGSPADPAGPTITAHAINTKGTGAAGRTAMAIKTKGTGAQRQAYKGSPITVKAITRSGAVNCAKSAVTGGEAERKAAEAQFAFMQADGRGLGWSCTVSGSEDNPTFVVGLFVPAPAGAAGSARADWSWGATNSGGRVSIVPHSAEAGNNWHIACASKEPRKTGYDLAVIKKP